MKETFTIGVLIGNANSPHTIKLMQGIYRSSEKAGINVIFFLGIHSSYYHQSHFGENTDADFDYQFNIVYDYSWLGKVDALIIAYGSMAIFLKNVDKEEFISHLPSVPYVLLEEMDSTKKGSSIITDNYNGMYQIAEHLVKDHQYKSIAFLSGPRNNTDASQRRLAVLDVMKKYHIDFDESHIEYGDFSECSEKQVNILLDRFPNMEALICANDVMADTAYTEIHKRGLTVGKDIAVTGFDDWSVANSMDPPLTTVQQKSYNMGYMSVLAARDLILGQEPVSIVVPSEIHYRNSCGCNKTNMIPATIESTIKDILCPDSDPEVSDELLQQLNQIFQYDLGNETDHPLILSAISRLLKSDFVLSISLKRMSFAIRNYIDNYIQQSADKLTDISTLYSILNLKDKIHDLVLSAIIKYDYDKFVSYQQKTWFLPLITKDMLYHLDDEEAFFASSMKKISSLGAKRSYIFIFPEPIVHHPDDTWVCPQELYLAAAHEKSEIYSFAPDDRPVLTINNGFSSFIKDNELFSLYIFCLFSGDTQYGIFATEISPADLPLSYLISIQIGNSLRNFCISHQQRETHKHLSKLVQEVHEKNELLNFISGYDTLTSCLNRRGFLERAMSMNRKHEGEQAFLIFADLDYLKEINDQFGHKEGDFAIVNCAKLLIETAGPIGITGRLGGDEFVTMIVSPTDVLPQDFITCFKQKAASFNTVSDKPYYVEASLGYEAFICSKDLSFTEILDQADKVLYENKRKRCKKTALKNPNN